MKSGTCAGLTCGAGHGSAIVLIAATRHPANVSGDVIAVAVAAQRAWRLCLAVVAALACTCGAQPDQALGSRKQFKQTQTPKNIFCHHPLAVQGTSLE